VATTGRLPQYRHDARNDLGTVAGDHSDGNAGARRIEQIMWGRRERVQGFAARGHADGGAGDDRVSSAGPAATGVRAAAWFAWGLGLLGAGLGVGAFVLSLPSHDGQALFDRTLYVLYASLGIPFSVVGLLIGVRRPGNRIGWVMLIGALSLSSWFFAGYAVYELPLPAVPLLAWVANWALVPALTALIFLLLLYPNGRLVSPRWRPVAWAVGLWGAVVVTASAVRPDLTAAPFIANPIGVPGVAGEFLRQHLASAQVAQAAYLSWFVLLQASLVSMVVRFRRARGVERQQLKWLVYAAAVAAAANLIAPEDGVLADLSLAAPNLIPPDLWPDSALAWWSFCLLAVLSIWAIAVAIGIAILKHHLYDIDRLINRTLVYGLLTAMLAAGYTGIVLFVGQILSVDRSNLALGQLFAGIGEKPPSWAVAGATLVVAALFHPARRRIQQVVDRRFNRRHADAATTITVFSTRLREQLDLDTLSAELLTVVDQTMEPTTVSLWLRPQAVPHGRPALLDTENRDSRA
jgi:hypothetical protein